MGALTSRKNPVSENDLIFSWKSLFSKKLFLYVKTHVNDRFMSSDLGPYCSENASHREDITCSTKNSEKRWNFWDFLNFDWKNFLKKRSNFFKPKNFIWKVTNDDKKVTGISITWFWLICSAVFRNFALFRYPTVPKEVSFCKSWKKVKKSSKFKKGRRAFVLICLCHV